MGGAIPGLEFWVLEESRLSKPVEVRQDVALFHGLCISSYLQVPALFEFLSRLPSVVKRNEAE